MSASRSLRVSEIFESVQGEGPSAGEPCAFLRLATCNLRCGFCDTKYTWDWSQYDYEAEVRHRDVESVARELADLRSGRLVITGGEPLLQQRALEPLLASLPESVHVEVETNGTLTPSLALATRINQWNVSPKLASSGEPEERRVSLDALLAFLATGRAYLKWVIAADEDADEALSLSTKLKWPLDRILFMPMATNRKELAERTPVAQRLADVHQIRLSPRLHIERWDGRRGV